LQTARTVRDDVQRVDQRQRPVRHALRERTTRQELADEKRDRGRVMYQVKNCDEMGVIPDAQARFELAVELLIEGVACRGVAEEREPKCLDRQGRTRLWVECRERRAQIVLALHSLKPVAT